MDKDEVLEAILKLLWHEGDINLSFWSIIRYIEQRVLKSEEMCAKQIDETQLSMITGVQYPNAIQRMSEKDNIIVNSVIWDLIIQRVLSPITDGCESGSSKLRITDSDKLEELVKQAGI